MDPHLAESLEIVDSFEREGDFKAEAKNRIKELKNKKQFKKKKEAQLKQLKGMLEFYRMDVSVNN